MKTKCRFQCALLGLCSLVLVGCNSELKHENETFKRECDTLKKDISGLQQQLQEMHVAIATNKFITDRLQSELDEGKQTLLKLKEELSSARSQLDIQNANVEKLTKELLGSQKANEKAEKALELYRDKASSAYRELKGLRSTIDESTIKLDDFNRNYLAAKIEVTKLIDDLPGSEIKRRIVVILRIFSDMKASWENSNEEMIKMRSECERRLARWKGEARLNGKSELETTKGNIRILEKETADEEAARHRFLDQFEKGKTDSDQNLQKLQSVLVAN